MHQKFSSHRQPIYLKLAALLEDLIRSELSPIDSLLADHSNQQLVPLGAAVPSGDLLPGEKLARTIGSIARRLGPRSIAPGPLFSAQNDFQNYIRLNCGHPWSPQIERSIGILGHLVKRLAR